MTRSPSSQVLQRLLEAEWLMLGALVLTVVLSVLVFNEANPWIGAILGALLGAIVTALVTQLLLRQQTQNEAEKERDAKVFEERLKCYDAFLSTLQEVTADGSLDRAEVHRLVFQFGRLKMVSSDINNVEAISKQLSELLNPERRYGALELQSAVLKIVQVFRAELFADGNPANDSVEEGIAERMKLLSERDAGESAAEEAATPVVRAVPVTVAPGAAWTGTAERLWYANTGGRSWKDMSTLGYWSCGGGELYRKMVEKLAPGDEICAYESGRGYVGVGIVTSVAVPIEQVVPAAQGEPDTRKSVTDNPTQSADNKEYAVNVRWSRIAPAERAWRNDVTFASPRTLCRLRDERTISLLQSAR
jgi:hypothetical protein